VILGRSEGPCVVGINWELLDKGSLDCEGSCLGGGGFGRGELPVS